MSNVICFDIDIIHSKPLHAMRNMIVDAVQAHTTVQTCATRGSCNLQIPPALIYLLKLHKHDALAFPTSPARLFKLSKTNYSRRKFELSAPQLDS